MVLHLCGHEYPLETAAVSAIRYRAAYGESAAEAGADRSALTGKLVRLCHAMIPPDRRPELRQFAGQCRREPGFLAQALAAQRALLAPDPLCPAPPEDAPAEPFDEYRVLAFMAAAGLDMTLIYELPVLHLAAVAQRVFTLKQGGGKQYRTMKAEDRAALYPRRSGKKRT